MNDRTKSVSYKVNGNHKELYRQYDFEYKYDDKGNCIEKKVINKGQISFVDRWNFKY
jgi:hypothetical protein